VNVMIRSRRESQAPTAETSEVGRLAGRARPGQPIAHRAMEATSPSTAGQRPIVPMGNRHEGPVF
jgi:hypothetical protein